MEKIVITKEDKKKFNETRNGMAKLAWKKIGCFVDILGCIGISLLILIIKYLPNMLIFYLLLYALLVFIVVGAEFIGTYYGALEQYVLNKKEKKEILYQE